MPPPLPRIVGQLHGDLLRLENRGPDRKREAAEFLAFLESELEAEVCAGGMQSGGDLKEPQLVRLESLDIELVADANELVMRRVRGSSEEFADLCEFIQEQYCQD